jgi:hypothetical protein
MRPTRWFIACVVVGACGDPKLPSAVTAESDHFVFHTDARDLVGCTPDQLLVHLEKNLAAVQSMLGFATPGSKVDYYYYDPKSPERADCNGGSGRCTKYPANVFTTRLLDRHELVHAYLRALSRPHALYEEGLAELLLCDRAAKPAPTQGWRELVQFQDRGFYDGADDAAVAAFYNSAAWFVRYLVDTFGFPQVMAHYLSSSRSSNPDDFRREFQTRFGVDLDEAWATAMSRRYPFDTPEICPCEGDEIAPGMPLSWQTDDCGMPVLTVPEPGQLLTEVVNPQSFNPRDCHGTAPTPPFGLNSLISFGDPKPLVRNVAIAPMPAGRFYGGPAKATRTSLQAAPTSSSCDDVPTHLIQGGADFNGLSLSFDTSRAALVAVSFEGTLNLSRPFFLRHDLVGTLQICDRCEAGQPASCANVDDVWPSTNSARAITGYRLFSYTPAAGMPAGFDILHLSQLE